MNLAQNNKRKNPGLKAISLLTALVFTWNTVSWGNPASPAPSQTQENVSALINGIHIPENIGKIESKYLPQTISKKTPVVFHIQDAHAHPEAQKNIQAILEHLVRNNGVKTVAVESAFGEISPDFLKFSSNASVNNSLIQYLAGIGEITGSELFAPQSRELGAALYGIEDPKLYDESFKIFKTVKFQKDEIQSGLNQYRRALESLESDYFTEELKEFVHEKRLWEESRENALGYFKVLREFSLKHLKIDFMDPAAQFNWPQLTHLLKAEEIEKRLNRETALIEMENLQEVLKRELPMDRDRDLLIQGMDVLIKSPAQMDFQVWLRGNPYRPEVSSLRHFFEVLYARTNAREIALLQYPNFLTMAGLLILHEEIDSAELFKEVETLEKALEKRLARNGPQKRIFQLGSDFSFMQRLLSLQLTREDHDAYLKRKADFSAKNFQARFKHFFKTQEELLLLKEDLIQKASRFYELSRLRDEALLKNAMRRAPPAKESATVLIAGGFHSEGLTELLRQKNIPHVVISPKMTAVESDHLYEQVMMGKHAKLDGLLAEGNTLGRLLLQNLSAQTPEMVRNLLIRGVIEKVAADALRAGENPDEIISEIFSTRPDLFKGVNITRDSKGAYRVLFGEMPRAAAAVSAPDVSARTPVQEPVTNPLFSMITSAAFGGVSALGSKVPAFLTRSELRAMDADAKDYLSRLSKNGQYHQVVAAIERMNEIKRANQNDLAKVSHFSKTAPYRAFLNIEDISSDIYNEFNIRDLPLAYRAAFALAAFDKENFPGLHERIKNVVAQVNVEAHKQNDRLTAAEYAKVTAEFSRAEHTDTVDTNTLLRYALDHFVFNIPRKERRSLERQALVEELLKELEHPGTGHVPSVIFLTDMHGSPSVFEFVAFGLGVKNYKNIRSVSELEARLSAENIDIQSALAHVVGGSDYVDRGPKPYWGFLLNKWLREHGKLNFIIGNHELWKDWYMTGMHLRVNDAFREILNSGNYAQSNIPAYLRRIQPFVITFGMDSAAIDALNFELNKMMENFLDLARQGQVNEDVIQFFADLVIDSGSNPNHSMEWWAREWGQHGNWFDTFFDQINEETINGLIQQLNQAITSQAAAQLVTILQSEDTTPDSLKSARESMLKNLTEKGQVFAPVDSSLFLNHPDVKAGKEEVERLRKINAEIRAKNEALAREGRFSEMEKQLKVESTFKFTAQVAENYLKELQNQAGAINQLVPGLHLALPEAQLVNSENARQHPLAAETTLWDFKNFGLLYIDPYGNAYLHGIIPIAKDQTNFDVQYQTPQGQTLRGVDAIERIQYDIRRFFESYEAIPDTPEFRQKLHEELGNAFDVLNSWYSDILGLLKPEQIKLFLEKGGPSQFAEAYAHSSALSARTFAGDEGVVHVGHVDPDKRNKQNIPYWVGGLKGGLAHGDAGASPGFLGLGAIITWFKRNENNELSGAHRFGYRQTQISIEKQIKAKKDALKKEADPASPKAAELQQQIGHLNEQLNALKAVGEAMEDITLTDLPAVEAEKIAPYQAGADLAKYFIERFLQENIKDYKNLIESSESRGLRRGAYYEARVSEAEAKLAEFRAVYRSELRSQELTAAEVLRELQGYESIPIRKEEQGRRTIYTFKADDYVYSFVSLPEDSLISARRERLGEQPSNLIEIKQTLGSEDYESVLRLLDEKSKARSELRASDSRKYKDLSESDRGRLNTFLQEISGIPDMSFDALDQQRKKTVLKNLGTLSSISSRDTLKLWAQINLEVWRDIYQNHFETSENFRKALIEKDLYSVQSASINEAQLEMLQRFLENNSKIIKDYPEYKERILAIVKNLTDNDSSYHTALHSVWIIRLLGDVAVPMLVKFSSPEQDNNISREAEYALEKYPEAAIDYLSERILQPETKLMRPYLTKLLTGLVRRSGSFDRYLLKMLNQNQLQTLKKIIGDYQLAPGDFAASSLFIPKDLPDRENMIDARLEQIQGFKDKFTADDFNALIIRASFAEIAYWANIKDIEIYREAFQFLTGLEVDKDRLQTLAGEAIKNLGTNNQYSSEFIRNVLLLLMEGRSGQGDLVSSILNTITKNPESATAMMAFLIVYLKLSVVDFSEHSKPQLNISYLLHSNIGPAYFLALKLAEAIPHPVRRTASAPFRAAALNLDELHNRKNPIFHDIRLLIHRVQTGGELRLVMNTMDAFIELYHPNPEQRTTLEKVEEKINNDIIPLFKEKIMEEFQSEFSKRVAFILIRVMKDSGASDQDRSKFFIDNPLNWQNFTDEERDSLEFKTAENLVRLLNSGWWKFNPSPVDIDEALSGEAKELIAAGKWIEAIQAIARQREAIKRKLLEPSLGVDPWIVEPTKRHQFMEENVPGYGFDVEYSEDRFDAFEKDRLLKLQVKLLQDKFFDEIVRSNIEKIKQIVEDKGKPAQDQKRLDEDTQKLLQEIIGGMALVVEQMRLDGLASEAMLKHMKVLQTEDLDLGQVANLINLIHDAILRVYDLFNLTYGDFPKFIAKNIGKKDIRPEFIKAGDENLSETQWAQRVQETLLADLYAEEESLAQLNHYVEVLSKLFKENLKPLEKNLLRQGARPQQPSIHTPENFSEKTSPISTGAKAYELLALRKEGFPVPPLAVLPSELPQTVAIDPKDTLFRKEVISTILELEKQTGEVFPFDISGLSAKEKKQVSDFRATYPFNPKAPILLFSARSGSYVSMPGMMETVLNLPFHQEVEKRLREKGGSEKFILDTYRRFLTSFAVAHGNVNPRIFSDLVDQVKDKIARKPENKNKTRNDIAISDFSEEDLLEVIDNFKEAVPEIVSELDGLDPLQMVTSATADIYQSWNDSKAKSFREGFSISDRFGTAVTLQKQVFGNHGINSGTAVVHSSDPETGKRTMTGAAKKNSQGVDLVSGITGNYQPLTKEEGENSLEVTDPEVFGKIKTLVEELDQRFGPQDIEITWQDGEVYLLQSRPMVMASGLLPKMVLQPSPSLEAKAKGTPISPNAAVGRILDARVVSSQEKRGLKNKIMSLRKQMDDAGENDLGIILIFDQFNDSDVAVLVEIAKELGPRGVTGIISAIGTVHHAGLMARKLGMAYLSEADLDFDDNARQIRLGDQLLGLGIGGTILSIDGYHFSQSPTSGRIYTEKVPLTLKSSVIETPEEVPLVSEPTRFEPKALPQIKKTQSGNVIYWQVGTPDNFYFETEPASPVDPQDGVATQKYFQEVYNVMAEIAGTLSALGEPVSSYEIQVKDKFFDQWRKQDNYREILSEAISQERIDSGFVDQMDLFRLLSWVRGKTEIMPYPELKKPQAKIPEKIALLVDAKLSDMEAAYVRDLIGNPDVSMDVIVGTTPLQLLGTLNHSIYRMFLDTGDVTYSQEEGWVEILGKRIRVIKNEEDISAEEWEKLGIRTFVATYDASRRVGKVAAAVIANGGQPQDMPGRIKLISIDDFNPFTKVPDSLSQTGRVAFGLNEAGGTTVVENHNLVLTSSLIDTPARYLQVLQAQLGRTVVASANINMNYRVSPTTAAPLDKSGESKAPTLNEVPVTVAWERYFRDAIQDTMEAAGFKPEAVQTVKMSSIPVMVGDRLDLTIAIRGEKALNAFYQVLGIPKPQLQRGQKFTDDENVIREAFIQKIIDQMSDDLFVTKHDRGLVNTDTRFERKILVDREHLGVFINNEKQLTLAIPLIFNRDWQDSRHVSNVLTQVNAVGTKNLPQPAVVFSPHLSPYGQALKTARLNSTIPPVSLEIPEKIDFLREKPLQIGIVGYAGQIGARFHVAHDLNLNVVAGTGGNPSSIKNAVFDSITGPLISNGVEVPIEAVSYEKQQGDEIGFIRIGLEGKPIKILKRFENPSQIDWKSLGVEAVAEATGAFTDPTNPKSLLGHLEVARGNNTGAEVVILSSPFGKPKSKEDQEKAKVFPTVVYGVNDSQIDDFIRQADEKGIPKQASNASCTTNCVATMTVFGQRLRSETTKLLKEKYGFSKTILGEVDFAPVTTVHSLTNTQPGYSEVFTKPDVESRHRAGPQATLTKSGVSDAIKQLREPSGASFAKGATGYAIRVPISASLAVVPMIFTLEGLESEDSVKRAEFEKKAKEFQADIVALYSKVGKEMALDPDFKEAVGFGGPEQALSSEVVATSSRMIIDAQQVHALLRDNQLMVVGNAWYDNVTNYADNYVRVFRRLAKVLPVRSELRDFSVEAREIANRWLERHQNFQPGPEHEMGDSEFLSRIETPAAVEAFKVLAANQENKNFAADFAAHLMQLPEAPFRETQLVEDLKPLEPLELVIGAFFAAHPELVETGLLKNQAVEIMIPAQWTGKLGSHGSGPTTKVKFETVFKRAGYPSALVRLERVIGVGAQPTSDNVYVTFVPARSPALVAAGRSELRDLSPQMRAFTEARARVAALLEPQDRRLNDMIAVTQAVTYSLFEPGMMAANEIFFEGVLGIHASRFEDGAKDLSDEEASRLAELMQTDKTVAEPKTVVLISFGKNQVPQMDENDFKALNLTQGSKVYVVDVMDADNKMHGWEKFSTLKLPNGIRPQSKRFVGVRPDLRDLKKLFDGAVTPILILPKGMQDLIENQYDKASEQEGFAISLPSRKDAKLGLLYSIGRTKPASLIREVPDHLLTIRPKEDRLSPTFIPLGAESRFANWALAAIRERAFATAA